MSDENSGKNSGDPGARQRQIRRGVARDGEGTSGDGAMQAGARRCPEPPFPARHRKKPGRRSVLDPAPMWQAPFYKGSGKLEDKVALVTGGDSGIGRAVAVPFAREGADVAITHLRDEDEDARVTQEAVEAEGRRCLVPKGDVGMRETCRSQVAAVVEAFGRIDVRVNDAAFRVHRADFADLSPEPFEETLRTSLSGMFHLTRAALPHIPQGRPQGGPYGGAIVNSGSVTGIDGSGDLIGYSMTRGASMPSRGRCRRTWSIAASG